MTCIMYITVKQLADHLGISTTTVYRYIQSNRLPAPLKVGPARWRRAELESVIGSLS
jgi:excisionase family DNA binding protein